MRPNGPGARWNVIGAEELVLGDLGLALLPHDVRAARVAVQHTREHEHQVGQSIEVLPRRLVDGFMRA